MRKRDKRDKGCARARELISAGITRPVYANRGIKGLSCTFRPRRMLFDCAMCDGHVCVCLIPVAGSREMKESGRCDKARAEVNCVVGRVDSGLCG